MKRRSTILVLFAIASVGLGVAPVAAGGGGHCDAEISSDSGTQVAMAKSCFGPTIVRVDPGTTVTWTNDDPYPHMVTGANHRWGSTDAIAAGETLAQRFDEPGVYPYTCMLHAGMTGAVVVRDAGAAAAGSTTTGDSATTSSSTDAPAPTSAASSAPDFVPLVISAIAGLLAGLLLGWAAFSRRAQPSIAFRSSRSGEEAGS